MASVARRSRRRPSDRRERRAGRLVSMTVPTATEDASEPRKEVEPGGRPDAAAHPERDARASPGLSARDTVLATCPYLISAGGAWRMSVPSRDHRCAAVDPPAPQVTDKQRRHCLSADHIECPMFRAARSTRISALAGGSDPELVEQADRRRRPLARTAPILLEPQRLMDKAVRIQFDRAPGQVALVGLMVVAFVIVALARFSAGGTVTPSLSPSASLVLASPSASPRPTATPSPPSAEPSASAAPSAEPSFRASYRVKKGDTLLVIASRFKTTAAAIRQLNGLSTNVLKVGQVLKIP